MNPSYQADERTGLNTAAAVGQDGTSCSITRRTNTAIAAAATAALAIVLCVGLLFASNGSSDTPHTRSGGSSMGKNLADSSGGSAGAEEGRVIPSMQPFSTTNPADAHCPHMDRPRGTWPTSAWGALANASMDLHTSLPTNAWWENIVLGFPTQVCIVFVLVASELVYVICAARWCRCFGLNPNGCMLTFTEAVRTHSRATATLPATYSRFNSSTCMILIVLSTWSPRFGWLLRPDTYVHGSPAGYSPG